MRFCDFLKFCNTYLFDNESYKSFMYDFFSMITSDDEESCDESSPFESDKYEAKAKKIYYGDRPLPKKDAIFIKSHFNENVFLTLVDNKYEKMPEHIQLNFENDLRRFDLDNETTGDISSDMCRVFLRYIDEAIDKKRSESARGTVIELDDLDTEVVEEEAFDEQSMMTARKFCIEHEDEKELIPLCQIANYINPLHKHIRGMYTEYNCLNEKAQRAIMFLNDVPFYDFKDEWEYEYLDLFREDIKMLDLVEKKDLLYDGGKYFHRARYYSDFAVATYDPDIFPAIPNKYRLGRTQMTLIYYIDEYLYYRNDEEMKEKLTKEVPFEWMINNLGLLNCKEEELVYFMCLFIYSACHVIPREYGRKDPEEIEFAAPSLNYIETMEDFYYAALMSLYNIYC